MKKIGELITKKVRFEVYYDDKARFNPYRVYQRYWSVSTHTWHRKMLDKYADLYSCTILINEYVKDNNEEER